MFFGAPPYLLLLAYPLMHLFHHAHRGLRQRHRREVAPLRLDARSEKGGNMRLNARAFGAAAGIVSAALFVICALAVAVAPESTTAFAGYLIHADLSTFTRTLTIGSFLGGLVVWTLGTAVTFGMTAALYNRLIARSSPAPMPADYAASQHA